jgi:bloom syndrome protein
MVRYCEDVSECRRTYLLQYFGEKFDRAQCKDAPCVGCDNCTNTAETVYTDLTTRVGAVLSLGTALTLPIWRGYLR